MISPTAIRMTATMQALASIAGENTSINQDSSFIADLRSHMLRTLMSLSYSQHWFYKEAGQ